MKGIGSFFDKFKNVALKEMRKREIVSEAIYKVINQRVNINIKNYIVEIKADQATKSEIFIKKAAILTSIPKDLGIIDIK